MCACVECPFLTPPFLFHKVSSGSTVREGSLRMAFVPLTGMASRVKWRTFWVSLQHNALQGRHNVLFFDKAKAKKALHVVNLSVASLHVALSSAEPALQGAPFAIWLRTPVSELLLAADSQADVDAWAAAFGCSIIESLGDSQSVLEMARTELSEIANAAAVLERTTSSSSTSSSSVHSVADATNAAAAAVVGVPPRPLPTRPPANFGRPLPPASVLSQKAEYAHISEALSLGGGTIEWGADAPAPAPEPTSPPLSPSVTRPPPRNIYDFVPPEPTASASNYGSLPSADLAPVTGYGAVPSNPDFVDAAPPPNRAPAPPKPPMPTRRSNADVNRSVPMQTPIAPAAPAPVPLPVLAPVLAPVPAPASVPAPAPPERSLSPSRKPRKACAACGAPKVAALVTFEDGTKIPMCKPCALAHIETQRDADVAASQGRRVAPIQPPPAVPEPSDVSSPVSPTTGRRRPPPPEPPAPVVSPARSEPPPPLPVRSTGPSPLVPANPHTARGRSAVPPAPQRASSPLGSPMIRLPPGARAIPGIGVPRTAARAPSRGSPAVPRKPAMLQPPPQVAPRDDDNDADERSATPPPPTDGGSEASEYVEMPMSSSECARADEDEDDPPPPTTSQTVDLSDFV
jgi:hypothetical protein